MSIQDILEKIIAEANAEAEDIATQSQEKIDLAIAEVKTKWEQKGHSLQKQTDDKISKALQKSESLAKTGGRNKLLAKKRAIISNVLLEVVNKLASLPAKDYEQLLVKLLESVNVNDGEFFPAVGKENSSKGALKSSGKNFSMEASLEIKGGFIVKSPIADFDYSFENLVNNVFKRDLEDIIIKKMF